MKEKAHSHQLLAHHAKILHKHIRLPAGVGHANQYNNVGEENDNCTEVTLQSTHDGGFMLHSGEEPDNVIVLDGFPRRCVTTTAARMHFTMLKSCLVFDTS